MPHGPAPEKAVGQSSWGGKASEQGPGFPPWLRSNLENQEGSSDLAESGADNRF